MQGGGGEADEVRVTAWVRGRVQGVGFRWWTRTCAQELGLAGVVDNLDDGRVQVVAQGPRQACQRLLDELRGPGAPGWVDTVVERWAAPEPGLEGFRER